MNSPHAHRVATALFRPSSIEDTPNRCGKVTGVRLSPCADRARHDGLVVQSVRRRREAGLRRGTNEGQTGPRRSRGPYGSWPGRSPRHAPDERFADGRVKLGRGRAGETRFCPSNCGAFSPPWCWRLLIFRRRHLPSGRRSAIAIRLVLAMKTFDHAASPRALKGRTGTSRKPLLSSPQAS